MSFTRVTSISINGSIPGERPVNTTHSLTVYRRQWKPEEAASYSVHLDISHWDVSGEIPVEVHRDQQQFDYEDGSEADAKFQHLALKSFTAVMTQRDRSY